MGQTQTVPVYVNRTEFKVHVVGTIMPGYDFIVGGDILRLAGLKLIVNQGNWHFQLGERSNQTTVTSGSGGIEIGAVNCDRTPFKDIVEQNRYLFYTEDGILPATGRTVNRIKLKTDAPVYVNDRRYPQALREIIKGQLDDLLRQGIIRPSSSPFDSPL